MKKLIYVFLIPFISLTIISCAKKSSEETNSTTTESEGKWTTICYLDSSDNHFYITTISVTGTNLEIKDEAHHDSSCNTDDVTTVMSFSSFSIGEEVTYSSVATGHKFTMNFDSLKYTPETAAVVSDLNTNSYCEYSDWALNTEKDITACFSSTIPANTTFLNIYKLVGNNLYLGFGSTSYPDSVDNEKAYIKQYVLNLHSNYSQLQTARRNHYTYEGGLHSQIPSK